METLRWLILIPSFYLSFVMPSASNAANSKVTAAIAGARAIVMVPIESPPLSVAPNMADAMLAANTVSVVSYATGADPLQATRTMGVVSGIIFLADLPAQTKVAAQRSERAEALLNAKGLWVPTVALAQEAQALIAADGPRKVRISESVRPLPGIKNRDRTFSMHNWYGPVKAWYRLPQSPFSYSVPEVNEGDLVLEVGLGNYELVSDLLFIYVQVKLVDPATGRTLAKDREYVSPSVRDAASLFGEDASGFKRAFSDAAHLALGDILQKIGLLQPQIHE